MEMLSFMRDSCFAYLRDVALSSKRIGRVLCVWTINYAHIDSSGSGLPHTHDMMPTLHAPG